MASNTNYDGYSNGSNGKKGKWRVTIDAYVDGSTISATATIGANDSYSSYALNGSTYLKIYVDGSEIASSQISQAGVGYGGDKSVSGSKSVGNGNYTVKASFENGGSATYAPHSFSTEVTVNVNYNPVSYYTISLNANGGEGDSTFTINSNQTSVTIPSSTPTRYEYKFKCWNTKADGSGDNYYAGGTWTIKKDTTLYAQWTYVGGLIRKYVNGTWKTYEVYVYRNKLWKRCDAYIYHNGWKKGKPL